MRKEYEERAREFWTRYYKQLEGARIVQFIGMNKDEHSYDEGFPAFKVQFKDGSFGIIEISKDEEGNGGGVVFGLVFPQMDDYDRKHKLNSYAEVTA